MRLLFSIWTFVALFATSSLCQEWHTVTFNSPSGGGFTEFSGNMIVPPLPRAGIYYLWPGLVPSDRSGIYQVVLNGRKGYWTVAPGWVGPVRLPWGTGITTDAGDSVAFNNTYEGPSWTSTVENPDGTQATSNFPLLGGLDFDNIQFVIELYQQTWDFGPLTFTDIVMTGQGTNTDWCTENPGVKNTTFSISGVAANVDSQNNLVTCTIEQLIMQGPSSPSS
ncbi:hypothetical protein MMC09_004527 [Bachmanniomyces sp. S44760]|nr:hypothetical protein [Bachmanniomyces sp. S44760]